MQMASNVEMATAVCERKAPPAARGGESMSWYYHTRPDVADKEVGASGEIGDLEFREQEQDDKVAVTEKAHTDRYRCQREESQPLV